MINWENIHLKIREGCKVRYDDKHFAEAVSFAIVELNDSVKNYIKNIYEIRLDGTKLFQRVFSHDNPILLFNNANDDIAKDIQIGYMQLFVGAWIGIRNPKAHRNLKVDPVEALEMIILGSHLFRMFDKAKANNIISVENLNSNTISKFSKEQFIYLDHNDDRRWIVIDNCIHHIHDGVTHKYIGQFNKNILTPTKVTVDDIIKYKPSFEIQYIPEVHRTQIPSRSRPLKR